MYNSYKEKTANKLYKKWATYQVEVTENFAEKLKSFFPANT